MNPKQIIYTLTDESPAMATYSWLPIARAFGRVAGVEIQLKNISLAARILASINDHLSTEHRVPDDLEELRQLVQRPWANIIKLPNISASVPQLEAAIAELRNQGIPLPDYSAQRTSYGKALGSAVNPVLRQGNSDRRVARAVKNYARKHPHHLGNFHSESRSRVASMQQGDFYSSERSKIVESATRARILWRGKNGEEKVLKEQINLEKGEVIDAAIMNCKALRAYYQREMDLAGQQGLLLSVHLKATMMKVSDPIIFGHAVEIYYRELFSQHGEALSHAGVDPRKGFGDMQAKIANLDETQRKAIEQAMEEERKQRPALAMVDSDKGISNLHLPNLVIIDASMPAMLKNAGQMWGPNGKPADTLALIPDRCYAGIYQEVMDFCRSHGAFDVATMGNVSNVGLMANKAQEYGSHDKTFELAQDGVVVVANEEGEIFLEHRVATGDIWRMCQTKEAAIRDWVKLAIGRARATGNPAIFWLDPKRSHDALLMKLAQRYLQDHDTLGLSIEFMSPARAMASTLERMHKGEDTISVTGNVLRDYLTDLFPILELGTSAKMLSIVPLLEGGGLYETGAGGSAPKHMEQLLTENHLRWDSLGEFLALAISLEDLGERTGDPKIGDLAQALHGANQLFLENDRSPSRKVGELDTRGSHFYLAQYWAQAMARGAKDKRLQEKFEKIYAQLQASESAILRELQEVQGQGVDIGGYYRPDSRQVAAVMRPGQEFNSIIDGI